MSHSSRPSKEKILRRLEGDISLIQRRLESINRRIESVPNLNRKILILEEERDRSIKAIKKEIKRNSLELATFIGFVEGLDSKDQKAEEKKEELLQLLNDLSASYQMKREMIPSLQGDSPPDIEV